MKDYLENYLTLDEQFLTFAEGIKEKYDMVLLSNDVWEWSEYLTRHYQLDRHFKDKIISGKVHMRKPEEGMFTYALEHLGKKPKECVFVDNSGKNLQVADKLGIRTVLFNRDNEVYAGSIVNDFEELINILKNEM